MASTDFGLAVNSGKPAPADGFAPSVQKGCLNAKSVRFVRTGTPSSAFGGLQSASSAAIASTNVLNMVCGIVGSLVVLFY